MQFDDLLKKVFFLNLCACLLLALPAFAQTSGKDKGKKQILRTVIGETPWNPENLRAQPKIIYGTDDRMDLYQETDPIRLQLAASVCALMEPQDVIDNGNGTYTIQAYAYTVGGYPPCPGEPYANQPSTAFCTGFLVGVNLIATAGHCYDSDDITNTRFVFGFAMQDATSPIMTVPASQVYQGVEIVGRELTFSNDYCIIRVDRNVTSTGALPLAIRRTGTVANGTLIGIIGHPAGLPLKLAFGGQTTVLDNSPSSYFVANLDSYGGNSGSPVFNAASGIVEGILVRGENDYVLQGSCFVSNQLPNSAGGEESTKSTLFESYVPSLDGLLTMDKTSYPCGGTIHLTILDQNAPSAPLNVTVTTGGGDSESLQLYDPDDNDQYVNTLILGTNGEPIGLNDGVLQGLASDTIIASYFDADDGTGSSAIRTATATLDCVPPAISNVNISAIAPNNVTLTFNTNETATGLAIAAETCGATDSTGNDGLGLDHTINIAGLNFCTQYFARIHAIDQAGNAAFDNNGGLCYSFTTLTFGIDALYDDFEPSAQAGWTHNASQGSDNWHESAEPYAHSPGNVYAYVPGTLSVSDARLISPSVTGGGELRFWHTYDFETGFDGGVLEASTNGGSSWFDLGPYMTQGSYTGTISTGYDSPIAGRSAWSGGTFGPMQEVVVNLQSLPGSLLISFRFAADDSVSSGGWLVDDVRVRGIEECNIPAAVNNWRLLDLHE